MHPENSKYDDVLFTIAKQSGGVSDFLVVVASFLKRRTDFFSGATKQKWETSLLQVFHKEYEIFLNEKTNRSSQDEDNDNDKEMEEKEIPKSTLIAEKDSPILPTIVEELSKPIASEDDDTEKDEVGKLMPNDGNGCTFQNYSWTQSLRDIELKIPIKDCAKPLRARDINIDIGKKSITVGVKGQDPIIDGELGEEIKPDESTWMLQDGAVVSLILEKRKKINWWDRLILTDPKIAVRKIKPESSKLSDLDDGTRATVEKMFYNQRQKQLGLPTSEDPEKREIIEKFKKTHTELDFSKCKY